METKKWRRKKQRLCLAYQSWRTARRWGSQRGRWPHDPDGAIAISEPHLGILERQGAAGERGLVVQESVAERAYWVAWSQVPGIGPTLMLRLYHHFGSLERAWGATPGERAAVEGMGEKTEAVVQRTIAALDPAALLQEHEQANPHFWTPAEPDYPRLLLEIPDPPPVLYYRGVVEPAENQGMRPLVGIVGTRSPTDYGQRWTRRLTQALVQAGFTVVSGMAEGVDAIAHQACLDAGGRTIGVMGTGVNKIYPRKNLHLARRTVESGLVVSEYPVNTPPDKVNFPRRNRIIAGLCRAILVLEAGSQSGALITARVANEYGREVYALPGALDNEKSRGCLELIDKGAQLILDEAHLLESLGYLPHLDAPANPAQLSLLPPEPPPLPPELSQVLQAVPAEAIALDFLVQETGLATNAVLSALVQLELMGLVLQVPGMRYQRQL